MPLAIGDRIRDTYGAPGVIVETGIRMRDSRDRVREAVKVDLDAHDGKPAIPGAYRFVDTCIREENAP